MSASVAPLFATPADRPFDATATDAVDRAAQALFANGLAATAEALFDRLATQPNADPVYSNRAALAREAHRADHAARAALQPGLLPLPSAQRTASGTPRFVAMLPEDALLDPSIEARFCAELGGDGIDAEFRNFLDEAITADCVVVDLEAGEGLAACSALTAPTPAAHVIARVRSTTMAEALRASAVLLSASARLTVVDATASEPLDAMLARQTATWVHVRAGEAIDVPAVVASGLQTIQGGRIASICWHLPANGGALGATEATAGTVLSVLGFQHFVCAMGADGFELVPFDGTPRGHAMVVSLSPAFLAAQATT